MKKKLKYYGGSGWEQCTSKGPFEVKKDKETKTFSDLKEAVEYYNNIDEEKSLWDVSSWPELLECHTY